MGQQQPTSLPEDEDNRISAIMTYPIRARYNNNSSSCIDKPDGNTDSIQISRLTPSALPSLSKESFSIGLPRRHLPFGGFNAREGRQGDICLRPSLHVLYTGAALFLSLIESDISMGLNYIVSLLTKDSGWGSTEFSPQSFLDTHIRCCCCYQYSTRHYALTCYIGCALNQWSNIFSPIVF